MRFLLLFLLALTILSACSSSQVPQPETPSYPNEPSYPNATSYPNQPAMITPMPQPYSPQPGDANFSRGEVFINSADLLIMESFPIQISMFLTGDLPTPCNKLRVFPKPPDEQNRIQVEVYSVINPAETCIQVLEPFEVHINLGSYPSGHYSVWVNGEMAGEFDS